MQPNRRKRDKFKWKDHQLFELNLVWPQEFFFFIFQMQFKLKPQQMKNVLNSQKTWFVELMKNQMASVDVIYLYANKQSKQAKYTESNQNS